MSGILNFISDKLKSFIIYKSIPKIVIDEKFVHLNYRVTTLILILFTTLLSLREYLGQNIMCLQIQEDHSSDPVIPRELVERYCFISTTFTVPYNEKTAVERIKDDVARYTGGQRYIAGRSEQNFHAYYQWVPFFLFFQAILFYLPHSFWKCFENKKISKLLQGLNVRELPSKDDDKKKDKITQLAQYLVQTRGHHVGYASALVFSEILNLLMVFGNMYLTDIFLAREFSTYGPEVVKFLDADPEDRTDPMARVFPRVTKCLFHTYGPSGSIQRFDALCILPSNILNEKIFTFLWFWYLIVALILSLALGYRVMTLISKKIRLSALKIENFPTNSQTMTILGRIGISDWFLLRLLRLNIDTITYSKLIEEIYEEKDMYK